MDDTYRPHYGMLESMIVLGFIKGLSIASGEKKIIMVFHSVTFSEKQITQVGHHPTLILFTTISENSEGNQISISSVKHS